MLIKEYRICLPMSVEEYRIAQLYMIQKKSREESSGAGSGVEILINEPYEDGPGGKGQYTHKIYHIGSHLPGWFRAILPKSALMVEEEAWNAYPYTRTIYRCPFIEKFTLFIETKYLNDGGYTDNVFGLSSSELRHRTTDVIDIVKDLISTGDYSKDEDPKLFISEKTGRGPLMDNWREEHTAEQESGSTNGKAIMCAYKLCKVEFKYWGMQSKIERFIHDIGLRKTMLRAHRQAWAWQDEYHGLTLADIRELERQTQEALKAKMAAALNPENVMSPSSENNTSNRELGDLQETNSQSNVSITTLTSMNNGGDVANSTQVEANQLKHVTLNDRAVSSQSEHSTPRAGDKLVLSTSGAKKRESWNSIRSSGPKSQGSIDWQVGSLEKLQASSSDDDEFFDAQANMDDFDGKLRKIDSKLMRSSSFDYLPTSASSASLQLGDESSASGSNYNTPPSYASVTSHPRQQQQQKAGAQSCKTTLLFLVLHGGSVLETGRENHQNKHMDVSTLRATFTSVISAHYPSLKGHVAFRLVSCPFVCSSSLQVLSSLNPGNFDVNLSSSSASWNKSVVTNDSFPFSAIPLFATGSTEYSESVFTTVTKMNAVYSEFLASEEGHGFNGQVCIVADSLGSIMAYDALCKNNPYLSPATNQNSANSTTGHHSSQECLHDTDQSDSDHVTVTSSSSSRVANNNGVSLSNPDLTVTDGGNRNVTSGAAAVTSSTSSQKATHPAPPQQYHVTSQLRSKTPLPRQTISCPSSRRTSSGSQSGQLGECGKFDFDVTDLFMFGSPLALILAYRKCSVTSEQKHASLPRPQCHHIYNLFYPCDLSALRLEPVIIDKFKYVPPIKIPRYQKFPLGDGCPLHVVETIQSNMLLFRDSAPPSPAYRSDCNEHALLLERRVSNMSVNSQVSGHMIDTDMTSIAQLTSHWWGTKRLDFALYSPEALHNVPHTALPYLLHSSFWESVDAVAFILRQVVRQELVECGDAMTEAGLFTPKQPLEKWQKRRTTIKLRNVSPNHRANDVIVLEDREQVLSARFMYGPLDMVSLTGEKVDIHIMKNAPSGDWTYTATEVTDSNGRATHIIPDTKRLPQGMYPIKMVVRGDHTCVDFYLTVLPPKTEVVVFSIDGAFTASMSIMGTDPKVRPASVDVVRHWQELGYMLLYVTARPDMQHKKVIAWLAQHNFPHGMVAFMDGLSAEPIKQKLHYLRQIVQEADIKIQGAYGSAKDISVYQQLEMSRDKIFIVGKASKKQYKEAVILADGYASHLEDLTRAGASRQASGNARFFLRKSCFSLPGQMTSAANRSKTSSKRLVRKTLSMPGGTKREPLAVARNQPFAVVSETGNTVLDPGCASEAAARARGAPPRPKIMINPRGSSKSNTMS